MLMIQYRGDYLINCNEYDYIEIVCMFNYPIKITLEQGDVIECIALDTQRNDSRDECILVNHEDTQRLILLDTISSLEVCVENPHFTIVKFT